MADETSESVRLDVGAEWDRRYAKPGFAYGTAPNGFLTFAAHHLPKGRVLSLGEGEGRNAVYMAELGCDVTAVDASTVGLGKARRLASERGVSITTVVSDLSTYRIEPEQWDGVVSIFCHLPPDLRRRVHRDVVTGLRPGGVLLVEMYTVNQLALGTGGPPVADLLVRLSDLLQEFNLLSVILAREIEREVLEGRCHSGRSAVAQLIAQKIAS
ncbi:MAG: class I SAM-dependent methyltransferase [Gemmatimonadota bacterium]|nr:class I SAM-dependent methyltransferase [Gemmatimonadota bacterium]